MIENSAPHKEIIAFLVAGNYDAEALRYSREETEVLWRRVLLPICMNPCWLYFDLEYQKISI